MKISSIVLYPPITSSLVSRRILKRWTRQQPGLLQTDQLVGSSCCRASPTGAAVSMNQRYGYVAAVCRSHDGLFLDASIIVFTGIHDPPTLEALAVREALALVEDLNLQQIHVASDCKLVVDNIKQNNMDTYEAIIHEIIEYDSSFNRCNFIHEFRRSNIKAHNLAKHALKLGAGRHVLLGLPENLSFDHVNL